MKSLAIAILLASTSATFAVIPTNTIFSTDQWGLDALLAEIGKGEPTSIMQKLISAAENGDARAQFMLAVAYDKGVHVEQDRKRANELVKLSAEGGFPEAMYVMADEQDREQNFTDAYEWYKKAAAAGEPKSMHRLAEMYRDGQGAKKNLGLSFSWVKLAADAGVTGAQYDLSVAYLKGEGCKQDFPSAYAWIKIASDKGHKKATLAIPKYMQNMPSAVIATGEKLYLQLRGE